LHKEFDNLLKNLNPKEDVLKCFEEIFLDLVKNRKSVTEEQDKKIRIDITSIEKKIDTFIERI